MNVINDFVIGIYILDILSTHWWFEFLSGYKINFISRLHIVIDQIYQLMNEQLKD